MGPCSQPRDTVPTHEQKMYSEVKTPVHRLI
jgi:hypothetical protein